MTNYLLISISLLSLISCENINTGIDTGDDTDEPDGEASITLVATINGEPVDDMPVSIETGPADLKAEGMSGDEFTVPAPASYRLLAGDRSETDLDGLLPIYTDPNGSKWIRPALEVSVEDGTVLETPLPMNPYFRAHKVECDHRQNGSEVIETYEDYDVETEDGYKLKLGQALGKGSWFEFEDGEAVFVGDKPDAGVNLLYFELTSIGFDFAFDTEANPGDESQFSCEIFQ